MLRDFEERIVRNPMLGAVLFWEFTRRYETYDSVPQHPNLLVFMPVLPILLHQPSVDKLKGMQFASGLAKVIAEMPTIALNLQQRISAFARLTLSSINVGCAAGLLHTLPLTDVPIFATKLPKLPEALLPKGAPGEMALAARRLGAFFRCETILQLQAKLGIVL